MSGKVKKEKGPAIAFRLPLELDEKLRSHAAALGKSLTQLIIEKLDLAELNSSIGTSTEPATALAAQPPGVGDTTGAENDAAEAKSLSQPTASPRTRTATTSGRRRTGKKTTGAT